MFEFDQALPHVRAHVTVRMVQMRYTEKGDMSDVMRENACAEDLLK